MQEYFRSGSTASLDRHEFSMSSVVRAGGEDMPQDEIHCSLGGLRKCANMRNEIYIRPHLRAQSTLPRHPQPPGGPRLLEWLQLLSYENMRFRVVRDCHKGPFPTNPSDDSQANKPNDAERR